MPIPTLSSRLNSMSSRPDLWNGPLDTLGRIRRAGKVEGLGAVDINYPQHVEDVDRAALLDTLRDTSLKVGAVNLRFDGRFSLGAFTHPDEEMRRQAIDLTIEAGRLALEVGARHVIVWPAHDGYDYPFQVDYRALHAHTVEGFRTVADALPELLISLEYKPLEPRRFQAASDMASSLLVARDSERDNVGVTLDFAHSLIAGENPAQAAAMALMEGRLFGIHLNDGYGRADDGLVVGSIHPLPTIELLYELQRGGYQEHIYFDTFPINEDPVEEATMNVQRVQDFWRRAEALHGSDLEDAQANHDALGMLDVLDRISDGHDAVKRKTP